MAKAQAQAKIAIPNDLEPYWMPFTANRAFKKRPRMIVGAKDMHYIASDGRRLLDGAAGLWCTNAGHNREPIVEAIQREAATLD
ncbi:MAG: aspartate aminotransferase family protein, partial [Pseudolabrys sp.]